MKQNSISSKIRIIGVLVLILLISTSAATVIKCANASSGNLKVYTGITGAIVYVDGVYGGSTDSYSGATVNGLTVGNHLLKLGLPGYKDWTKQVSIDSGQTTTVYAYLETGTGTSTTRNETIAYNSPLGILKVNTGLTGVSVYLGGEYGGSTDSYSGAKVNGLITGTYSLKLSMPGYKDWTKQIAIDSGQTTTVYAYLEPGNGVSTTRTETIFYNSSFGYLRVYTGLSNVNVYIDGEYGGSTDSYSGTTVNGLIVGSYSLKLGLPGYKDWTKQVSIDSGQTTTVYAYLETGTGTSTTRNETIAYNSPLGILKVNTGLTGVSVYLGGEYGGSTDSYSGAKVNGLITGTYSLKLSMPGYKDWTKQIAIDSGQTTTVYAYLEPGNGVSTTRSETISYNSPYGTLKVYTGLTGVSVYVGGEYGSSTDSYSGATINGLIAGTYTLKLSMSGYKDWTKQVSIIVGKTTTVYAYLENGTGTSVTRSETISYDSPFGSLNVNTEIDGVNVYVGGEFSGTTNYGEATVNGIISGVYTLKLTATGYDDWTQQITIITGQTTTVSPTLVLRPGSASFSYTPTNIQVGTTVKFQDSSSGVISSWQWNFGDGSTSFQQNPEHVYSTAGDFTVTLTVFDITGSNSSVIKQIHVAANSNTGPTPTPTIYGHSLQASFTANFTSVLIHDKTSFQDTSTGSPTSWLWDFGDGTTSTERNPIHAYSDVGTYTVTLTVFNMYGNNIITKHDFIKANPFVKPIANFGVGEVTVLEGKITAIVGKPINFSDLSNNTATSWLWDFGDGTTSTEQNPVHTYWKEENYTVTLTASNSAGSDTFKVDNYIMVTSNTLKLSFSINVMLRLIVIATAGALVLSVVRRSKK